MNILYNLPRLISHLDFIKIMLSILIVLFFFILSSFLSLFIIKLLNIKIKDKKKLKQHAFYFPLKHFIRLLGLYIALVILPIPKVALPFITKGFKIITILLITKALTNSVNPNSFLFKNLHLKLTKDPSDTTLLVFISKTLKVLIYALTIVIILKEFGYDINGLIAGLGIAGLTVSLAMQDAAKNLFGGIIIILDKPFKQGDWIQTSTLEGIVEEITFRSSRIRTFDDTVIIVPNSTLSNVEITNWSKMNKRKVLFNIQLDYATKLTKINNCISEIQNLLYTHENVDKEVINVYFTEIADSGYNIMIHYFTTFTQYSDYLKVKENINFKIMNILEKEKVELAYPSQTIYTK